MNIVTSIIFCFFLLQVKSQDKIFQASYNSDNGFFQRRSILIVKNDSTFYITQKKKLNDKAVNKKINEKDRFSNHSSIFQSNGKLKMQTIFAVINSNDIYLLQDYKNKPHLVKDLLPVMNWQFSNDSKNISGLHCKKATLNFRGSFIEAWYTEAIPISAGPWKFKGLPGLIVEVYTVRDTFTKSWSLTEYGFQSFDNSLIEFPNYLPRISLEEKVKLNDKYDKERASISNSRVPNGVKVVKTIFNRLGVEKSYEWEKSIIEKD